MKGQSKLKEYNAKRDFKKTAEPEGAVTAKHSNRLAFVVQKHEASHLHYDVRLEVEGVMKSWAVPKGPSFDPSVKRLAVQVEDHPVSYNDFEGTIPSGEYGGGTVMVWDHGTYTVDNAGQGDDSEGLMLEGIDKGKLSITFHGLKLRGSFALVRTRLAGKKAQWLMIKHKDEAADPDYDPVADAQTSAKTERTMEEIKKGASGAKAKKKTVKGLDRAMAEATVRESPVPKPQSVPRRARVAGKSKRSSTSVSLLPMLIHIAPELPEGKDWVYEQKLDGVRLLAYADAKNWVLISRLGNDKSKQFPELGAGLKKIAAASGGPLILDGEVVAIDPKGQALGFQFLQGRIHLDDHEAVEKEIKDCPVQFLVFDALLLGNESLVDYPLRDRRALLEKVFEDRDYPRIALTVLSASAQTMKAKALKGSWEGLIAKDLGTSYVPGSRTRNWLKWKTVKREELIIGAWTEPKGSRKFIGSLLLGYYDEKGQFIFAGHVGSGFNHKILGELHEALCAIEQERSPFAKKAPNPNDIVHWVVPKIVAEVKFQEWTSDRILRQPIFLGIRDDKRAEDIVIRGEGEDSGISEDADNSIADKPPALESKSSGLSKVRAKGKTLDPKVIIKKLQSIEEQGDLSLPGAELRLTHLNKVVFPKDQLSKRDLLEYYTLMAEYILPWMKDRPLVLRRFPSGIEGKDFYQQAPDEGAPVSTATIIGEDGEKQTRLIGGDLTTLLYTVQMSCVSYDPWHSKIHEPKYPDYTIIDLDPGYATDFETVRSVALAVLDFLQSRGLNGAMKTSGATGIHIYLPLPPKTSWEQALLAAEIVCGRVAETHANGTIERSVKKRKKGSVYLDSQQNFLSKSVAGVWAVRARPGATVSTPITRAELEAGITPSDFTIVTVIPEAKKRTGLWNKAMAIPIKLEALL